MKREEFCEVLGDINENYVKEAGANPKAERRRRFKWKVIAACLCLLLAAPLTVFAMDTIQYHAAVDYLRSLGIPVEDLSDYSRTEIKEAVKTMDAGESSLLTEEILNLLPDSGEPIQRPTQVTSEQVRELTPTMTREEVLSFLGDTQDIGSGILYIYKVDGEALLGSRLQVMKRSWGSAGEELLKTFYPRKGAGRVDAETSRYFPPKKGGPYDRQGSAQRLRIR